jgi:hypothetical protein
MRMPTVTGENASATNSNCRTRHKDQGVDDTPTSTRAVDVGDARRESRIVGIQGTFDVIERTLFVV